MATRRMKNGFRLTGKDANEYVRQLGMKLDGRKKCPGEIVNPHVLPHAEEPKPDFEAMRRATHTTKAGEPSA